MQQKRFLLALLISASILFGWTYLQSRYFPAPQQNANNANSSPTQEASTQSSPAQQQQPSPPPATQTQQTAQNQTAAPAPDATQRRTVRVSTPLYDVKLDGEGAIINPQLRERFGVDLTRDTLVVVRPPASEALYHRFENELFDELLRRLLARPGVKVLLLARTAAQREALGTRFRAANLLAPREALDGANLVSAADLVVSAGGTMNREAAALGVPAATVYAGRWAAVDEQLVREGRLKRIITREDVESLRVEKKGDTSPRRRTGVRSQVAELILR